MSSSVIDAFKRLNMSTAQDSSDHEAVFEVSYQYLSKVKNFKDINSFHNCIVSLINSDKYYRALQLVDEVPEEIHGEFAVEKAYVYYKTGHFDQLKELYKTAAVSGDNTSISARALKHVMAQSFYQNGHITEALHLYRELISSNSVDNEVDIACNERAILSQLAAKENVVQKPVTPVSASQKTYDIVFNEALTELAGGNITSSLHLLEEASAMCLEQNMDSNPADLALEIAPINLTTAYIHQITGNSTKALSVLESLDLVGVTDLMTRLTFKNNYLSLSGTPANVNFASRELNYKDNLHQLRHKLTRPQFQVLIKNNLLLAYQSGTLSKTSSYLRSKFYNPYSEDFPGDITPVLFDTLVRLDISMRDLETPSETPKINRKLFRYCLKKLQIGRSDDKTVAATLLLVHLNSRSSKYEQSILILEKLVSTELSGQPETLHASVFGTLMNVYEISGNSKKLEELYITLTEKFSGLPVSALANNRFLYDFGRAFAFKLSAANFTQEASSIFKLLSDAKPSDALVSSVLTGNRSGLVPAEELESPDDVETLLAVNVEDIIRSQPARDVSSSARGNIAPHKVTKKTHKPKFSKTKVVKPEGQFNAEKDLDKERWLPMKLRSYYKPSKKDLKKKSGGHQGAVESSPAPTPAPQQTASSSSNKNKSKNKKQKKKGKK